MCQNPLIIRNGIDAFEKGASMYVAVPCGKCPDCIKKKISEWTLRTKKEIEGFLPYHRRFTGYTYPEHLNSRQMAQFNYPPQTADDFSVCDQSNEVWFFTFTYDDVHLPETVTSPVYLSTRIARPRNWRETGNVIYRAHETVPQLPFRWLGKSSFNLHPLNFKDMTDVLHTFNKYRDRRGLAPFSYLLCGEYGSHTHRPHYHALIIGISRTDAYRLANMWQKQFCPQSLEYSYNPIDKSADEVLFSQTREEYVETAMSAMEYRHQFNKIGVLFRIVDVSDMNNAGRCAGYIAKYIVKGGDDWSKKYPNLVKPRATTSKGFGVGYHYTACAGKDSQIQAKSARSEYLKTVYFPQNVEKIQKNEYNTDYLHIFAENLTVVENGIYRKQLPRQIRECILPTVTTVSGLDKVGVKHTRRIYPLAINGKIPKSYDLRNALSAYNLQQSTEKYLDAFRNWLHDERCIACPVAYHIYLRGLHRIQKFRLADTSEVFARTRRELKGADQF